MNSRCRRMDPAQSLCGHELLWSQRPSDENIRVCDFLCYAVVVFKLKKVKIRKSGLQLIAQPWRRMPEFETMMVDDEDFHFCRFAPNRQAASLMVNATRACCSGLGARGLALFAMFSPSVISSTAGAHATAESRDP